MRSRRSPGIATLTPRLRIYLSGRDLAGKLSSGMEHVHAWRVRMLTCAGELAEVPE